jgi:aminoglycoside 6'-N-acetyltransferase I
MRSILWPDGSYEEHLSEAKQTLATGMNGILPMVTLVAEDETGSLVGFLDVGLRSHADGCDERQPVGFVEGWFVDPRVRQRGVGRALMQAAEEWARSQGCREMASDTWIDNLDSQQAHLAMGFEIVDRCVNFRKSL